MSDLVALLIITVSIINVYAARFGAVPDVLLLVSALTAFTWVFIQGIDAKRMLLYLAVMAVLFVLYFSLSVYKSSYPGFRNSASVLAVSSVFVFFWKYSHNVQKSRLLTAALVTGMMLFVILSQLPIDVAKNLVNSATCYFAIAAFICVVGLKRINRWNVSALLFILLLLSIVNNHRTMAALSILFLLQYAVLSVSSIRKPARAAMFVGMFACGVAVVALLVREDMLVFASAFNEFVASQGERTIMSGRQTIWPAIWDAILRNPSLGLDPGASTGSLYATKLSAHNLYLEVGLQLGFVGIFLVILMFWSLWRMARPSGRVEIQNGENFMTCLVTMVAAHSLFDVFLTQDSLAAGVPAWIALGVGLGGLSYESTAPRRGLYRPAISGLV